MRRLILAAAAIAALGATGAAGQFPAPRPPADTGAKKPSIRTAAESVSPSGNLSGLLSQSRQAGVPDAQVQSLYDQLRQRGVTDADAQQAVSGEVALVRAGAKKQTFGATVNQQIARGLRGRDLATAIRAEHERQRRKPPSP